jgi:prepilin-type N-terminal cleavage/methylation domain-containing protein
MFREMFTSRLRRVRRGFTLIEASVTTVIIGVGCVAMLELLATGTLANNEGAELTTAMNLAGNVRECMTGLSYSDPVSPTHWGPESGETSVSLYNDVDDFDGKSFSPPIDARRNSLGSKYSNWKQSVKVESVNPTNLTSTMSHLTLSPELRPTCRCTVTVTHNGHEVYSQWWIATYADPSVP